MAFLHLFFRKHAAVIKYIYIYDIRDICRQIYMYICMHKEVSEVIPHKNLPEFKLPFSTKCHSHYRELQFKNLTGLKLFFSTLLTSFHRVFLT